MDNQRRFVDRRRFSHISEKILKFLYCALYLRSVLRVPYKDASEILKKLRMVGIFLKFFKINFGEQLFSWTGDLDVEVDPVGPVIEIISGEHFVEKTSQGPNV